jgi:hypothetical protein
MTRREGYAQLLSHLGCKDQSLVEWVLDHLELVVDIEIRQATREHDKLTGNQSKGASCLQSLSPTNKVRSRGET